jgi:predicted nucleotidyltransferase component of viral defense system
MTRRGTRNVAASVRARLLKLAHAERRDYLVVLQRFALERLLHRLTLSPHADRFTLKGAMLFIVWAGSPHRATRDLDLLARGEPEIERLAELWREVAAIDVNDGVRFERDSVSAAVIREGREHEGVRVLLTARIEAARIDLQIDVGFGDAVVPRPKKVQLPVLLDFPAPALRAYAPETVVAEKLHAMVEHGIVNTRLKDYYDVWWLMERKMLDDALLVAAIVATFTRRKTPVPSSTPPALSDAYATDATKEKQWAAFCLRAAVADAPGLAAIVATIEPKLMAASRAAARPDR